jgi:hypothetical protein
VFRTYHLFPILAGAAIAMLCGAGMAVYLGWIAAPPAVKKEIVSEAAGQVREIPLCGRCGVIEAVREALPATVARGSLTGAPLGQQLVGFSRDLTNMIGLLMVAMAGGPPVPEAGRLALHEIAVRFEDGSSRILIDNNPTWKAGDRVKVVNGRIRPDPAAPEPIANTKH